MMTSPAIPVTVANTDSRSAINSPAQTSRPRWAIVTRPALDGLTLLQSIRLGLPAGWWVIPAMGATLILLLANGIGLGWFVGKYALTGKDFQEVLGPSILAAAVAVATYFCLIERTWYRMWMIFLPTALLCRELHFSGTGTGVYIALVVLAINAIQQRAALQPLWNCPLFCCFWLGAFSWYAMAVTIDSGVWKSLPHHHWWSVNLEETMESGGHLCILLGLLASAMIRRGAHSATPVSRVLHFDRVRASWRATAAQPTVR